MKLLPSQLNQLYDIITQGGYFSPSQFEKSANGDHFKLTGSEYYFRIFEADGYANSFIVNFAPGESFYKESSSRIGWHDVSSYFANWLYFLKREVIAPDKWGRLLEEMRSLIGTTPNYNAKFSHAEYLDISYKFEHIKSSLTQIPLLKEQNEAIINQLDNLLELTNKLNKFDWQNLFIGTIISIIIQLNVTPENASLLYELIKTTFKGLFLT
ncbi:MAG TPA: hypothetical protein VGE44_14530 [Daejeonella sp.]|uniref:hypothetical protein n=1 Tax=Daejeonella sp. TaxID=2805397 RepID=UPI002ED7DAD8